MELQHDHKIRHHEAAAKHPFASSAPPSASSSPAHEFSFAVSLQPSSTANLDNHQPPSAIDLTPADEIFFHGHLLPLHLLPNLSVSPRSSTNSLDQGFNTKIDGCICSSCDHPRGHSFNSYEYNARRIRDHLNNVDELPSEGRTRTKAKSFSLFGLARRRKEGDIPQGDHDKVHKKKARFDMTHFLKRYTRMFLFSSKGRPEDIQFSAPASMRTSPTNSLVISSASTAPSPPSNDSTMEELQAAIQAAIAHCKDSISTPEKLTS